MTIKELRDLLPGERVAGYIQISAKMASLGARLRHNGRNDEDWTEAEMATWDEIADETDIWFYAMTESERTVAMRILRAGLTDICCGEWPVIS